MLLQYCSLHARLFSWKDHTWKDFSRAKISQIQGIAKFSVLPSLTLQTSKSSKVRVIDVQRPSNRYYVRNCICPLCTALRVAGYPRPSPYDIETSNVLLFPIEPDPTHSTCQACPTSPKTHRSAESLPLLMSHSKSSHGPRFFWP